MESATRAIQDLCYTTSPPSSFDSVFYFILRVFVRDIFRVSAGGQKRTGCCWWSGSAVYIDLDNSTFVLGLALILQQLKFLVNSNHQHHSVEQRPFLPVSSSGEIFPIKSHVPSLSLVKRIMSCSASALFEFKSDFNFPTHFSGNEKGRTTRRDAGMEF